jgi:hypothetical protein
VLHVGTVTQRHFDDEDVELLRMVADRVALATQASLSETERNASLVMQRSLLPDQLPDVAGFETAVRYTPGAGTVRYTPERGPSGAIGTTCSPCRPGGCSSPSVTWSAKACARPS